jgi:diacylglycerol kinase (ATP)
MQKARVIYNPSAGRELVKKKLPYILERLEQAGYEASCHATTGAGDATRAAEQAVNREFDLVVAAGGDGTIYEVVNGLAEKRNRPKLGIIPAGTTNDFARALEIPRSIEEACDIFSNGNETAIDIGKVNKQYFINIAGGGTMTELTYEVPSKLKTMLGQLAYYIKGIEKLVFLKPTQMHIQSREMTIDEEIMIFLVANSHSIGGQEKLLPNADLRDGYFDVLVVKKTSLAEFIRLATLALRGEHLKDPRVIHFQSSELKITSKSKVQVNLDGELGGNLPCHFKVLHKHLTILTPNKKKK